MLLRTCRDNYITRQTEKQNQREMERVWTQKRTDTDLQEELKGKKLMVFLFDKKVIDAPLSKFVKHHDSKQCSPKYDKQYQHYWPSSVTPSTAAMQPFVISHLSLSLTTEVKIKNLSKLKYEWLLVF